MLSKYITDQQFETHKNYLILLSAQNLSNSSIIFQQREKDFKF